MNRIASLRLSLASICLLAACGGSPPSAPLDAGPIVSPDAGPVPSPDAGPIVSPDAGPIDSIDAAVGVSACSEEATVELNEPGADGTYAIEITTPVVLTGPSCSFGSLDSGRVVRFTAPTAGTWSVTARGLGLQAVEVRRSCDDASTAAVCLVTCRGADIGAVFEASVGETFTIVVAGTPYEGATFELLLEPPLALGEACDRLRGCEAGLVCAGIDTPEAACAVPTAPWIASAAAYVDFPNLAIVIDGREATSAITAVEFVPLDVSGLEIGAGEETAYVATSESDSSAVARFYVRCVAGAMATARITLVDASGARSEPMFLYPITAVRVDSGELCDGLGAICWSGACAESSDGEMRCL